MKKKYIFVTVLLFSMFFAFEFDQTDDNGLISSNQPELTFKRDNAISKLINERKNKSYFTEFSVLKRSSKTTLNKLSEFSKKSDIFELNESQLQSLFESSPQDIILKLDTKENGLFELQLTLMKFSPAYLNIKVIGKYGVSNEKFKTGLAYSGIIDGDNNSFASLTVFENCVMGIICNEKGNFVLGPKKNENNGFSNDYVFYNDRDLLIKNNFKCGTDDYSPLIEKGLSLRKSLNHGSYLASGDGRDTAIRAYFVTDYQMYLDNGSNTAQVVAFVNAVYNNVSTIYLIESIPTGLAPSISVYAVPDPYMNLTDSYQILNLFGSITQDNYQGDIAHLLSTGHNQQLGGIAWVNVLCQPYVYIASQNIHHGRFAFSNIENSYLPYPTYSWTVEVVTHEIGHNIASKHTHACVWPTASGQIDSCYTSEGGCVIGTQPNYNATIMSYCHLNGAIVLANGFGDLPRDTIQLGYYLAGCLDTAVNSSEMPLAYDLMQNYPNPFNPGTSIRFAMPENGFVTLKVYDIAGREVATLVSNKFYEAGFFEFEFDASFYNLASGVYLYKMDVNKENSGVYSKIKKMVYVK